jgi:hypothetical protein
MEPGGAPSMRPNPCLQPFAGFGFVSENRVLEAVTAECSCIISSGKWPNGRRLTARVAAKVRRAALAGRSRLVALERAGEFRAKRNRRSRPA